MLNKFDKKENTLYGLLLTKFVERKTLYMVCC